MEACRRGPTEPPEKRAERLTAFRGFESLRLRPMQDKSERAAPLGVPLAHTERLTKANYAMTRNRPEDLKKLPPLERARRAKELMDEARDQLAELGQIRAEATAELRSSMSAAEIAAALGISRQQATKIIGQGEIRSAMPALRGEGSVVIDRRRRQRETMDRISKDPRAQR